RQLVTNAAGGLFTIFYQTRWAIQFDGVAWITYVDNASKNIFRAQRSGNSAVQRCYTDFFPQQAGDLKADLPANFPFTYAHVVARLEPDGHTRLWVIGFPPSFVTPVSQALETELRRARLWQAFSPSAWRRWRSGVGSL